MKGSSILLVPASKMMTKNKNLILIAPLKDTAFLDTNAGMYAIQVLQPMDDIGYTVCYMKTLYYSWLCPQIGSFH